MEELGTEKQVFKNYRIVGVIIRRKLRLSLILYHQKIEPSWYWTMITIVN